MSDEEVSQAEDDEAEGEEWHGFGGVDDDIEGEGKPQEEGTSSAAVSAAPSGKSLDYSAHFYSAQTISSTRLEICSASSAQACGGGKRAAI